MILAHHGGLLSSVDPDELLGQLEAICADAPGDLRLASESSEDRVALLARLAQLRSSPQVRQRYVELVSDVWSALSADWERDGRLAVKSAVAVRHELKGKGLPWREVAGNIKTCNPELLSELVGALGPRGTIAIVPAYFAHLGLMVDLPGTVVIGVRADGLGVQSRARTELLARRLKTISDPTRLAMLEAVGGAPFTVSELAAHFSLAQPTVSNHVKLLRESGILSNRTVAGRRVLSVERDVLAELLDNLGTMLALPERGAGFQGAGGPGSVVST
jgi:DNA-binding transcriptional ArsR family regulator